MAATMIEVIFKGNLIVSQARESSCLVNLLRCAEPDGLGVVGVVFHLIADKFRVGVWQAVCCLVVKNELVQVGDKRRFVERLVVVISCSLPVQIWA